MEETNIKTRHKAIVVHVEKNNIKNPKTTHFRTKINKWDQWQNFLEKNLFNFVNSYPEEISKNMIEKQARLLTKIIVDSATISLE